jgi:hypothetical protein
LALVIVAALGLGLVGAGANAQDETSTSADGAVLSETIPPCPPPEPFDGRLAPHPYQPGDPICSAEGTGVLRPAPLSGGITAGLMQKNVATWTTASGLKGIMAWRTVSNPTLDANDTQYHTMHAGGTAGRWIEIGWGKWGDGRREIYTETKDGFWTWGYKFPISTGQTIQVDLDGLLGSNNWEAMLYWNGTWWRLTVANIGTVIALNENILVESFTSDSNWPSLPATWVTDAQLYRCAPECHWVRWNTSIPNTTTWGDDPYHIHFTNQYYYWYAHRH